MIIYEPERYAKKTINLALEDFKSAQKSSFQHKIHKINEIIALSKAKKKNEAKNMSFFCLKENKFNEPKKNGFFEEIHLVYDETVERIGDGIENREGDAHELDYKFDRKGEIIHLKNKNIVVIFKKIFEI